VDVFPVEIGMVQAVFAWNVVAPVATIFLEVLLVGRNDYDVAAFPECLELIRQPLEHVLLRLDLNADNRFLRDGRYIDAVRPLPGAIQFVNDPGARYEFPQPSDNGVTNFTFSGGTHAASPSRIATLQAWQWDVP
jgi:hypothetical protein